MRKAVAAGFIGELGEARKANLQIPGTSGSSSDAHGVQRVDNHVVALANLASGVHVRAHGGHAVIHGAIVRTQTRRSGLRASRAGRHRLSWRASGLLSAKPVEAV